MNARSFSLAAALCAALSSAAHADTRVGLGATADYRSWSGTAIAALATDAAVLEVGLGATRATDGDVELHQTDVSLAVLPVVARRDRVALEVGLRAELYHTIVESPGAASAAGNELVVTAPIRVDVAVAPWLSLYAETDVLLANHQAGATQLPLQIWAGLPAIAGFTIWF
jgi:hypothetical protein